LTETPVVAAHPRSTLLSRHARLASQYAAVQQLVVTHQAPSAGIALDSPVVANRNRPLRAVKGESR
jgi:hypothetical protein